MGISQGAGAPVYSNSTLLNWSKALDYSASSYYPPTLKPVTDYSNQASGLSADKLVYVPFVPRVAHTFTKLAFYNSSAAETGRKFRLGIYASASGRPTTLVVDGGETTIGAAAAFNEVTISQLLSPGALYFLAEVANTAISGPATNNAGLFTGVIDLGASQVTSTFPVGVGWSENFSYAALPANSGTLISLAGSTLFNPLIWIKG